MKLVIGGAHQGKRGAACRLFGYEEADFADGRTCALAQIETCRAVAYFHEYILRCMQEHEKKQDACLENWSADAFADWLIQKNPGLLIVSDEIGYGVVPMERELRAWREETGRICCRLAAFSDTVVRVVAGIPAVIKQQKEEGKQK